MLTDNIDSCWAQSRVRNLLCGPPAPGAGANVEIFAATPMNRRRIRYAIVVCDSESARIFLVKFSAFAAGRRQAACVAVGGASATATPASVSKPVML